MTDQQTKDIIKWAMEERNKAAKQAHDAWIDDGDESFAAYSSRAKAFNEMVIKLKGLDL